MADIIVRVKTKEQLEHVLSQNIAGSLIVDHSLLPFDIGSVRNTVPELRLYLQLPDILREKDAAYSEKLMEESEPFDGIVIKTFDQLGLLSKYDMEQKDLIGDSFLYAYNSQAVSFYRQLYPKLRFIISDELTDREYQDMAAEVVAEKTAAVSDFIYKIYGYQPLMVTEQCIRRNYHGCKKGPETVSYFDRMGNRFYAHSECSVCYNLIYNGLPTSMIDKIKPEGEGVLIDGFYYPHILADLTIEDGKAADDILLALKAQLAGAGSEVRKKTRGHHYDSVE